MSQTTSAEPDATQLDGVTRKDAFVVAGLSAGIGKDNMFDIPALWPKLMRHVPIQGQRGKVGYGLCYGTSRLCRCRPSRIWSSASRWGPARSTRRCRRR